MANEMPIDFVDDDPDDNEYSYRRVLDLLMEKKELILTIEEASAKPLKRNLTALKSRDAAKLKNAGLEVGDEVLGYTAYPTKEGDEGHGPNMIKLHITYGPRKTVKIHKLEVPDNEF